MRDRFGHQRPPIACHSMSSAHEREAIATIHRALDKLEQQLWMIRVQQR
jgi:hypothetical protein